MTAILGANGNQGEYQVTNSGLFGLAGTFLTRTQSDNESDTDRRKFTFSGWYKQTLAGSAGGWNGFWIYGEADVSAENNTIMDTGKEPVLIGEYHYRDQGWNVPSPSKARIYFANN